MFVCPTFFWHYSSYIFIVIVKKMKKTNINPGCRALNVCPQLCVNLSSELLLVMWRCTLVFYVPNTCQRNHLINILIRFYWIVFFFRTHAHKTKMKKSCPTPPTHPIITDTNMLNRHRHVLNIGYTWLQTVSRSLNRTFQGTEVPRLSQVLGSTPHHRPHPRDKWKTEK